MSEADALLVEEGYEWLRLVDNGAMQGWRAATADYGNVRVTDAAFGAGV
jgi:hypothetical protein